MKATYVTFDGKVFDSSLEARSYEQEKARQIAFDKLQGSEMRLETPDEVFKFHEDVCHVARELVNGN